jgi:hypothetical protein
MKGGTTTGWRSWSLRSKETGGQQAEQEQKEKESEMGHNDRPASLMR